MEEKLAISTVYLDGWIKARGKGAANSQVRGDLKPRAGEDAKSCWAHVLADSKNMPRILACRPSACRELQALALFIFKEQKNGDNNVKHRIEIVSVYRKALDSEDVIEDVAGHPILGYQETHRSIKTSEASKREAYAEKIVRKGLFECYWYDRTELRIRLRFLIENGEIHQDFLPAAMRLLERWTH